MILKKYVNILTGLTLILSASFTFPKESKAIVNKSVQSYEAKRKSKGLNPEPFSLKTLDSNLFERVYNLGSDVVIRVFTSVNVKNAKIFRADIYLANKETLPSSEAQINKYIEVLAGGKLSGIPKTSYIKADDGRIEVLTYSKLKVYKVRNKDGNLIMIRVMDKSECKRLKAC
jgi:hypothetical protein